MRAALIKRCSGSARRTRFMVSAALSAPTEQYQIAGNDLSAVFLFSALLVFPARGLQPPLNVNLGSLFHILADDLRQPLPGHNVVPFRAVLPFACFVFITFIGCQAEFGHGN